MSSAPPVPLRRRALPHPPGPRLSFALLALACSLPPAAPPSAAAADPLPDPYAASPAASATVPATAVDALVEARLAELGVPRAPLCSDAVFLRRASLALTGTLPTAAEARAFLDDPALDKRARLVDRLLQRDAFADWWALRWGDLLRLKSEFPVKLWPNAVQAYHKWLRDGLRDNRPGDAMACDLLTASGSNFRVPPVNFLRAVPTRDPASLARACALFHLGQRIEAWPEDRAAGLAAFFAQLSYKPTTEWKEEIVFHDPAKAAAGSALLPDGTTGRWEAGQDPRTVLAAWLFAPGNPAFARAHANRTWAWLTGRGLVHEPDDLRPDNPPVHPALLDHLAAEYARSGYDFRHLLRTIVLSRTWQATCVPPPGHPEAAAVLACFPIRQLEAEVLLDALHQLSGTGEEYVSPIPEPFTHVPATQRTIALADGSIGSPFLEMFGRPPRDSGLFAERPATPTFPQRLHFLNSSHVRQKVERGPAMAALLREAATRAGAAAGAGPGAVATPGTGRAVVETLYLAILSRRPTEAEYQAVLAHTREHGLDPRSATADLAWALVNTAEFLFHH